ncbi:putative golgi to ER traffic protein [Helianthus annuus]|nr:putative golgi to ER traffic protein [Helianthus annuus]
MKTILVSYICIYIFMRMLHAFTLVLCFMNAYTRASNTNIEEANRLHIFCPVIVLLRPPILDRIRKIYKKFPRIPFPQNLDMVDDDDAIHRLSETFGAAKIRVESCSSFLKAAIKWSADSGPRKIGSPELHDMLAEYIYSESPEPDMTRVCYHFARGRNPNRFASTLVNFMGKCYPGEDDLAIARAVLMYLSIGNLRDANNIMDEIEKLAEVKGLQFPDSELMRFINYLLQTLMRDALPLFNTLKQKFSSSIERDPMFNELLEDIGEKFYGVRRKNPLQGMFGELFKRRLLVYERVIKRSGLLTMSGCLL